MITKKTVLILGAGCSHDYGYPLGEELKNIIIKEIGNTASELNQTIKYYFKDNSFIQDFSQAFLKSGQSSIDSFLENRKEFMEIGKLAIAKIILSDEDIGTLFLNKKRENSLYQHIYEKMGSKEDFNKNLIKFVTFNYDRSLEAFFYFALKNSYGIKSNEIKDLMNDINIVHVYGAIGDALWNEKEITYGNLRNIPAHSKEAADKIKIVNEIEDEEKQFKEAKSIISWAERIVFLGFHYHPINMKRLDIPWGNLSKTIFGTCYRFTQLEKHTLNHNFGLARLSWLGDPQNNAISYLRNELNL